MNRAFTMAEFIVVITIIVLMLGFVSFDYRKMQQRVEASNLAEDIALTLRQAQTYGLSSSARYLGGKDFNDEEAEVDYFEAEDIVHEGMMNGFALLYKDKNDQNPTIYLYQNLDENPRLSDDDKIIDERKILSKDISIERLILHRGSNKNEVRLEEDTGLYILFERPYPDAYIFFGKKEGSFKSTPWDSVDILIEGKKDNRILRVVSINSIGNITVRTK